MKIKNLDKDYSISFTRCIAMLFIVLCHIFQYYDIELCWWFNVGVQIFFVISGWLYFNRKFDSILSVVKFYYKNILKLLIDYYIYISALFLIFKFINKVPEGMINLFNLSGTISGLGHLWFIKYILICYLLIPIFTIAINLAKRYKINYILLLAIPLLIEIFGKPFYVTGAWINCFYFGMILHSLKDFKYYNNIVKFVCISAILLNLVQIYLQYILKLDLMNIRNCHYLCEYAHAFLGLLCFYLFMRIYEQYLKNDKLKKFLNVSDKYSYDVYLTHHIYILGTYSFFNNSNNIVVNLISLTAAITLSTCLLNLIASNIKSFIFNYKAQTVARGERE